MSARTFAPVTIGGSTGIDRITLQSTLPRNSSAGREFQINTHSTDFQLEPAIAALADGGFVVTWLSDAHDVRAEIDNSYDRVGSYEGIYGQRYRADGIAVGREFRINTYTINRQLYSAVTGLSNGGFVVTWDSYGQDGNYDGIYGQRYGAGGTAVGREFRVNSYTTLFQRTSAVAALSDGGFVVTWASDGQDGSDDGIYGQRYGANGQVVGGEFRVNTYTSRYQTRPAVAALAEGGFIVTWDSANDGSHYRIYGQRYDANGQTAGSEFRVNTSTSGGELYSSVAGLSDGGFVTTWDSYEDGSASVCGQRYDANGQAIGGEFQVNTYTTNDQRDSTVAALSDGGFVVVWHSYDQAGSGSNYGTYGQRYSADGTAAGSEFRVSTIYSAYPSVAALEGGGFVVTWESDRNSGWASRQDSGYAIDIYGQRYGADGQRYGAGGVSVSVSQVEEVTGSALNDMVTVTAALSNGMIDLGDGQDTLTLAATGAFSLTVSNVESIMSGSGADTFVITGSQRVTIVGGSGNDTITGGSGGDSFVFQGGAALVLGTDLITDFVASGSSHDTFTFDQSDLGIGASLTFQSGAAGSLADGNLLLLTDSYADANAAAASIAANAGIAAAQGAFVFFNATSQQVDVVSSADLGNGGAINTLARIDKVGGVTAASAGVGIMSSFSTADFSFVV